ncbi:hypothetical protein FLW53_36655, partial [Microbispora sp. SCL1-1]|uniref:hypothetical protein n=1 Tax=Microbispora sp. SCL1-1 TaxID=2592812 RepID=UPI001174D44E
MDLFDIDPEHHRHSNGPGDGEWWDRLIANSPLWSSDGSSAREPFPIINFGPRQRADAPSTETTDGVDVPGPDAAGANAAGTIGAGANAARWTADSAGSDARAACGVADRAAAAGADAAGTNGAGANAA